MTLTPVPLRSWLLAALSLSLLFSPLPLAGEGTGVRAQEQRLPELLRQAETWRGLRAKRPVESRTLGEKELSAAVLEAFREDLPAGVLRSTEISLKAFGLIPESLDLAAFLPRLLTQQIAGFYDPEKQALSLVRRTGQDGEAGLGAQRAEDMILVHELAHALQDQHFDLETFTKTDPMSDASTARQALVEGDATLTMMNAFLGFPVEEVPGAEHSLQASMGATGAWMTQGSEGLLGEAPPFLRETLLFSYSQGSLFCLSVRRKGGQKLLDHAFRSDPPSSSEQILHPEKWHGRRDDPVAVEWPDLAPALPGLGKAAEGEMGELAVYILLREGLKDETRAAAAAAGWGGDRFAVYQKEGGKDGRRLLAWITEWDAAADAEEFAAAAQQLGPDWRIERPAAQRVIVLRGDAPRREAPLLERLAKATARRPANRAIDLAALGIRDEDRAGSDPEKLMKLLEDPELQKRIREMLGVSVQP